MAKSDKKIKCGCVCHRSFPKETAQMFLDLVNQNKTSFNKEEIKQVNNLVQSL
jgi:hypothetical protein